MSPKSFGRHAVSVRMRDRRTSDNPTGRPTVLRPLHPLRTRKCAQKVPASSPKWKSSRAQKLIRDKVLALLRAALRGCGFVD